MSINRVQCFGAASAAACQLLGKDFLTVSEAGTLSMAVQALEKELQAEQFLRALNRCAAEKNLSDACYRILRLAYQDWTNRVAPEKTAAYREIVEALWQEKAARGNKGMLNDFVLISTYKDYPEFYKALDLMHSLTENGGN